jgi:hypothetical protein
MIDAGWVSVGIVAATSIATGGISIGMIRQGQKNFIERLDAITKTVDGKLSADVHTEVVRRIDGEIAGVRGEVGSVRGEVSSVRHAVRNMEQRIPPFAPPARGR